MLFDKFGRKISYLRLAITDRCNLRCQYCMPAEGIDIVDREELLTYKEMYRLIRILSELGVNKVRLTGGEPFVRKDFINFLESLAYNNDLEEVNITTNGALISKYIPKLEELNINAINLSLDTLNRETFKKITRRDKFDETLHTLDNLLKTNLHVKINMVAIPGVNTDEIVDFIELTKHKNLSVRFIEEMPFNGVGLKKNDELWNYDRIIHEISQTYKNYIPLENKKNSTSKNFQIEGYKGTFGIIPAFTRTICHDCNRIRITATGMFKNCLFDDGVFNIRDLIRSKATDEDIKNIFISTIHHKPENGFIAETNRKNNNISESMSTIGG